MRAKGIYDTQKGFTLIELIVVIAIIAILAAVAIPGYIGQQKRAARTEAYSNLENLRLLEEQFYAENGVYTASLGTCAKDNDNIAVIASIGNLPGFKPGSDLNFSYCVQQNVDINGSAQTPCFRARAFGNSSSRVNGETFAIDCNNDRTF